MSEKRPKINIPLTPLELWVDRISFLIFFSIWFYVLAHFSELPEVIPTHYDGRGVADAFGSKQSIWLMMGIFSFMFIGIFILNKFPHLHNYTVKITQKNALKNYRFSTRILRVVNLFNLLLLAYILKTMMNPEDQQSHSLGRWFLPLIMMGSVVLIIYIFVKANKINS